MKTHTAHLEGKSLSIEEFAALPDDGWMLELVRGKVVRDSPAGFEHGDIGVGIASILRRFVRDHDLGKVVGADTGFVLFDEPPTVRAPDAAFVAKDRLTFNPEKFAPLAPDLAVEIVSPSDTMPEIQAKVLDYLDAGTRLVWLVEPRARTITVYRSRDKIRLLTEEQELDGGKVLPGFRLKVSKLFDD